MQELLLCHMTASLLQAYIETCQPGPHTMLQLSICLLTEVPTPNPF